MDRSFEKNRALSAACRRELQHLSAQVSEPLWNAAAMVSLPPNRTFVSASTPCSTVYYLLEGKAIGVDEQIVGNIYPFVSFSAPEFFGDFELFSGIPDYRISLKTVSACTLLAFPAELYLQWIQTNAGALFNRTQSILRMMIKQSEEERKYLFLKSVDRLVLFLIEAYENNVKKQYGRIPLTRQQISDQTGYCVKTINRSIVMLEKKNLLSITGGKIKLTQQQYAGLRNYAEKHAIKQ